MRHADRKSWLMHINAYAGRKAPQIGRLAGIGKILGTVV